jgi:hypothetical protein
MSEPNRLSAPGERAALARVEVIAERLDELPLDRFVPARHTFPEPEERARLLAELEREAGRCGRSELLADVCNRLGTAIRASAAARRRTGGDNRAVLGPRRLHRCLALVELALTDAALVAVMEDRLDPVTAAKLAGPGGRSSASRPSVP